MKRIIIIPVIMLMLFACKKEENTDKVYGCLNIPADLPLIKTESFRDSIISYFYDDDRRVTKTIQINSVSGESDTTIYTYYTDSLRISNSKTGSILQFLTDAQLATFDGSGNYVYDARCYKRYWMGFSGIDSYVNFDSIYNDGLNYLYVYRVRSNIGGPRANFITYKYDTAKKNTIGNSNRGMPFWGASSYNVVKETIIGFRYDTIIYYDTLQSIYEFDMQQRIVKSFTPKLDGHIYNSILYPADTLTTFYTYY